VRQRVTGEEKVICGFVRVTGCCLTPKLLPDPEITFAFSSGFVLLSGSGSTMLAMLEEDTDAETLRTDTLARYGETCWTWAGRTI